MAALDVVRAVPPSPEMHHSLPPLMLVPRRQPAVVWRADGAAECEPGRHKLLTQADVECHIRVVRMHCAQRNQTLCHRQAHSQVLVRSARSLLSRPRSCVGRYETQKVCCREWDWNPCQSKGAKLRSSLASVTQAYVVSGWRVRIPLVSQQERALERVDSTHEIAQKWHQTCGCTR